MIKRIFGTLGVKLLQAITALAALLLNARLLGPAELGNIALVVLAVAVLLLFSNVAGGAALVYLASRHHNAVLLLIAYGWTVFTMAAAMLLLPYTGMVAAEFIPTVLGIAALEALVSAHSCLLTGRERLQQVNIALAVQSLIQLGMLAYFLSSPESYSTAHFFLSLYLSRTAAALLTAFYVAPLLRQGALRDWQQAFQALMRHGVFVQLANVLQLFNYRWIYYAIGWGDSAAAKVRLGIYAAGNQLAEGLWMLGRSMGTVQYAQISVMREEKDAVMLSLSFLKISVISTALGLGLLLSVPAWLWVQLLGEAFGEIRGLLLLLAPGILGLTACMISTNFFSGAGRHHLNTIGSLAGAVLTVAGSLLLIPRWGLSGAACTASVAYLGMAILQWGMLIRIASLPIAALLPGPADWHSLRRLWKGFTR